MSIIGRYQLGSSKLPTRTPTTSDKPERRLNNGEPHYGQKLRLTVFPESPVTVLNFGAPEKIDAMKGEKSYPPERRRSQTKKEEQLMDARHPTETRRTEKPYTWPSN